MDDRQLKPSAENAGIQALSKYLSAKKHWVAGLVVLLAIGVLLGIGIALSAYIGGKAYFQGSQEPTNNTFLNDMKTTVENRDCDYDLTFVSHSPFSKNISLKCFFVSLSGQQDGVQAKLSIAVFKQPNTQQSLNSSLSHSNDSQSLNQAAATPLVYLSGGPGSAYSTGKMSLLMWDEWLSRFEIERDLVLIDLRGLAPSEPSWGCKAYSEISAALLKLNLSIEEENAHIDPIIQQCIEEWKSHLEDQQGPVSDLTQFNSQQNAQDLRTALLALGYSQWDLLAVSYGTRVALIAGMTQKEVRRLVLDSPYLLNQGGVANTAKLWKQAFDKFWADCRAQLCSYDEVRFWRLLSKLDRKPLGVEIEHWQTSKREQWLLNGSRLVAVLYASFYNSEVRSAIPEALNALEQGNTGVIQPLLELFYNNVFDSEFNSAIYWATECNDNVAPTEEEFKEILSGMSEWARYFATAWRDDICQMGFFGSGKAPSMQSLQQPVLVVAGENDPITTAEHAQELMTWLSDGHLLILPNSSHAEFFSGECAQHILPWFLAADRLELRQKLSDKVRLCTKTDVEVMD